MKNNQYLKLSLSMIGYTGSQSAAVLMCTIENYFGLKRGGFYKFSEACPHRLYRDGDSFCELLGVSRKKLNIDFQKIGVTYNSRSSFEAAKDKFQGKPYARYYDRNTNLMHYVRNHELADQLMQSYGRQQQKLPLKKSMVTGPIGPFRNGHFGRSIIEAKNTTVELSNDNSHASSLEIVKKMVEVWTAIVEQGKNLLDLTSKRIAFLNKAFTDKFNSSLEQWERFCKDIASSRFLMGESKGSSFKATLDWALKFDVIQKIREGWYGIGDRARELTAEEVEQQKIQKTARETERQNQQQQAQEAAEQGIRESFQEPAPAVEFRVAWLRKVGAEGYRKTLEGCSIEVGENGNVLAIHTPCNLQAKQLVNAYGGQIESLVQRGIAERVRVFHQSEFTGLDGKAHQLVIDRWFGEAPALEEPIQALELSPASLPEGKAAQEQVAEPLPEEKEALTQRPGELNGIVSLQAGPLQAANQDNPPEAPVSREVTGGLVAPLPQVAVPNPQTLRLQGYLRDRVPNAPQPFLEGVRFEGTHQSQDLVIFSFGDGLAAQFYQKRYERELLQAARDLWAMARIKVVSREGDCPDSLASVVKLEQRGVSYPIQADRLQAPHQGQVSLPEDEASLVQKALLALRKPCFKIDGCAPC